MKQIHLNYWGVRHKCVDEILDRVSGELFDGDTPFYTCYSLQCALEDMYYGIYCVLKRVPKIKANTEKMEESAYNEILTYSQTETD